MSELDELGRRWRRALEQWALPPDIVAAAPISPWVHPPEVFRLIDDEVDLTTAAMTAAAVALGAGGTVADIGCGGGRASLPLGAAITEVIGVDDSEAMLGEFRAAAARRGVPARTVAGRWPEVASSVPTVDVVVCHHVVYNVADIVEFVTALTDHARRRVVVELTGRHPQSGLNELWKHFWGLERPSEPTSELLVRIVAATGVEPIVSRSRRPSRRGRLDADQTVALVRRRLCLGPERDEELRALLTTGGDTGVEDYTTVVWSR
jgi:SAM-dependent methyltransferase